ncbi:MAG: hypothetical protein ABFD69_06515 [Candidatus Sumerlaeia bacterium]
MKASSVKPASARRLQHLCEVEILALPKGTFMNFDQDFRAQITSGQPLNAAVPARFLTHRDVRVLIRPRLIIADGETGAVVEADDANTTGTGIRVELTPAGRPDGSVRLHADMRIPARDKRGRVVISNDKTPQMNLISEDRIVQSSADTYQCYRPESSAGAYDVFVFVKLQTLGRP